MSIERPSFLSEKYQNKIKVEWQKRSTQQNKWGLSYKVSGGVVDFPQMKSSERKGKKSRFNSSFILAIIVEGHQHRHCHNYNPQHHFERQDKMTSVKNRIHAPGGGLGATSGDHSTCRAHLGRRHLKVQHPISCSWMLSEIWMLIWRDATWKSITLLVDDTIMNLDYALKSNTKNLEAYMEVQNNRLHHILGQYLGHYD